MDEIKNTVFYAFIGVIFGLITYVVNKKRAKESAIKEIKEKSDDIEKRIGGMSLDELVSYRNSKRNKNK